MSDLNVVFVPSRKLKEKSRDVTTDEFGEELHGRMMKMSERMYKLGGVGISGVQLGDMRRILVFDPQDDQTGLVKMVNPVIIEKSEDEIIQFSESCISFPDFETDVDRYRVVKVQYYDANGQMHLSEFDGVNSVIVQHEMDHLEGVTILDKVSRLKRDIYLRKVKKLMRKLKRLRAN